MTATDFNLIETDIVLRARVKAVRVTVDNVEDVARWTRGSVVSLHGTVVGVDIVQDDGIMKVRPGDTVVDDSDGERQYFTVYDQETWVSCDEGTLCKKNA